jgi:hypothetical protein
MADNRMDDEYEGYRPFDKQMVDALTKLGFSFPDEKCAWIAEGEMEVNIHRLLNPPHKNQEYLVWVMLPNNGSFVSMTNELALLNGVKDIC